MGRRVHIVIAEPSIIIRSGLSSVLKRIPALNIDVAEIGNLSSLPTQLRRYRPDILIVNPMLFGAFSLSQIKNDADVPQLKVVALLMALANNDILKQYDECFSVNDSPEVIREKLNRLVNSEEKRVNRQELSSREKEIIGCVVKGLTNKQIADLLCLSTHTIMTHRRNIANKLQIHSPAGLTIYAIVNKIVEINDIKGEILPDEG